MSECGVQPYRHPAAATGPQAVPPCRPHLAARSQPRPAGAGGGPLLRPRAAQGPAPAGAGGGEGPFPPPPAAAPACCPPLGTCARDLKAGSPEGLQPSRAPARLPAGCSASSRSTVRPHMPSWPAASPPPRSCTSSATTCPCPRGSPQRSTGKQACPGHAGGTDLGCVSRRTHLCGWRAQVHRYLPSCVHVCQVAGLRIV